MPDQHATDLDAPASPLPPEHDAMAWADAGGEAVYYWHLFTHAKDPLTQANYLTILDNHMHDLKTWLPDYDPKTMTLSWERDDENAVTTGDAGARSATAQPGQAIREGD